MRMFGCELGLGISTAILVEQVRNLPPAQSPAAQRYDFPILPRMLPDCALSVWIAVSV
jgi:hypothetical protein